MRRWYRVRMPGSCSRILWRGQPRARHFWRRTRTRTCTFLPSTGCLRVCADGRRARSRTGHRRPVRGPVDRGHAVRKRGRDRCSRCSGGAVRRRQSSGVLRRHTPPSGTPCCPKPPPVWGRRHFSSDVGKVARTRLLSRQTLLRARERSAPSQYPEEPQGPDRSPKAATMRDRQCSARAMHGESPDQLRVDSLHLERPR